MWCDVTPQGWSFGVSLVSPSGCPDEGGRGWEDVLGFRTVLSKYTTTSLCLCLCLWRPFTGYDQIKHVNHTNVCAVWGKRGGALPSEWLSLSRGIRANVYHVVMPYCNISIYLVIRISYDIRIYWHAHHTSLKHMIYVQPDLFFQTDEGGGGGGGGTSQKVSRNRIESTFKVVGCKLIKLQGGNS